MPRVATLLGEYGRPADRVQVLRKGKINTRIRRSTNYGRSWSPADDLVATELILNDASQRFEQHSSNPTHATLIETDGTTKGRLRIQRFYTTITKAYVYQGNSTWSDLEEFATNRIVFDGGVGHGWNIPTWHQPLPAVVEEQAPKTAAEVGERRPEPAPAALVPAPRGQRFSYLRVSSTDQNLARQRMMIGDVDKEFLDEVSARSRADRPGLDHCIDYLGDHDELIVASIDRLARSLVDLRGIIDQITAKGASVHFIKENLTFSKGSPDPRANLMLSILGSFAEFERAIIRERQADGITLAKKAGKYKGRKRALTPEDVEKVRACVAAGESKVSIAEDFGVGRATLYRALSQ